MIGGLILTEDSVLYQAPRAIGIAVAVLLIGSLALALAAFGTRSYELAPEADALVPLMRAQDEAQLRYSALPNVLEAIRVNEPKVAQKATFLFQCGLGLLMAVLVFGGYFIYEVATRT